MGKARYNFKFGEYTAQVQSPDSEDTHFAVYRRGGRVKYDDYGTYVTDRWNTRQRLEELQRRGDSSSPRVEEIARWWRLGGKGSLSEAVVRALPLDVPFSNLSDQWELTIRADREDDSSPPWRCSRPPTKRTAAGCTLLRYHFFHHHREGHHHHDRRSHPRRHRERRTPRPAGGRPVGRRPGKRRSAGRWSGERRPAGKGLSTKKPPPSTSTAKRIVPAQSSPDAVVLAVVQAREGRRSGVPPQGASNCWGRAAPTAAGQPGKSRSSCSSYNPRPPSFCAVGLGVFPPERPFVPRQDWGSWALER